MTFPCLKIGGCEFKSPVILAPMAGVTDQPFRRIIRHFGKELIFSEMVLADSLVRTHQRTEKMASFLKEEKPIGIQLVGHTPEIVAEAAARIEGEGTACLIDINMGCPVQKIVKSGSGSALMLDEKRAQEIVETVAHRVSLPITVKFRLGWDDEHVNFLDFGRRMEEAGAAAVTLHARTRARMYGGQADWSAIALLKSSLSIPVIGNGDVRTPSEALDMKKETEADGIMIGRGILGKPWLLGQCSACLKGAVIPEAPSVSLLVLEHFRLLEEYYGTLKSVFIARKHMAWYSLGWKGGAQFREKLNRIKDPEEAREHIMSFFMESSR